MHIQGRKLKSSKELQKGVLYEFSDSRIITFTEQEIGDVVDVEYQLDENEKGFYSKEYRPDTIAKEDAKVIDITAFIIDEKKEMCYWWLYDLKKDVGGRDVVQHLCQQWQAAYRYLNNSVLNYLSDIFPNVRESKGGSIGVITRNFDTRRIKAEFESVDKKIKEIEEDSKQTTLLAIKKARVSLPVLREERNLLDNVLHKRICFRCAGKNMEFPLDVKISTEREKEEYYYCLECSHNL